MPNQPQSSLPLLPAAEISEIEADADSEAEESNPPCASDVDFVFCDSEEEVCMAAGWPRPEKAAPFSPPDLLYKPKCQLISIYVLIQFL